MIFLYAQPVLSGFSNYLFPLVLGARDMAFPRHEPVLLLALPGGRPLHVCEPASSRTAPNDGWFNYVPYAQKEYNPGPNMDFYALGMIFLGISTTVGSANFVVTFMRMRAPGMSINRVPILTWGTTTISVGNLLAVPSVSLAFLPACGWTGSFGTHFYRPTAAATRCSGSTCSGCSPIPGSTSSCCRRWAWCRTRCRSSAGDRWSATPSSFSARSRPWRSASASGCTTCSRPGFPFLALVFFSGASFIIAIPSAVAVFAWIATIWTGRPVMTCAFLYFAAFIVMFTIGGVSGVMTAAVPADLQLTSTYFVVAHIHYVLIGINLFAVLGALHVWFPKMTGRMMDERLGLRGPSGSSSSASTSRSCRCTGPASSACRGASTPTRPASAGRHRTC